MAHNDFGFGSSIPVLRMLDETEARGFYLDYLGYQIDWEHRFNSSSPTSPLYMQISRGASVLHLNGHADADAPPSEVRIPVCLIDEYCEFLRAKDSRHGQPSLVDPRYTGVNTDMNIEDPFGNLLTFWRTDRGERAERGDSATSRDDS